MTGCDRAPQVPSSPIKAGISITPPLRLQSFAMMKLFRLRGRVQRQCRRLTAGDHLIDFVKVPGANLALMPRGRVALRFGLELCILEIRVRRHASGTELPCQFEHAEVQRMKAG